MTTTRDQALIQSLVAELRPVRRLPPLEVRALVWGVAACAAVAIGALALRPRVDLPRRLADPTFLAQAAALLVAAAAAAWRAFQLSVPGADGGPLGRLVPLAAMLGWIGLVSARAVGGEALADGFWSGRWLCVARTTAMAIVPAVTVLLMLRRGAPIAPGWTGFFALLSASALAIAGTQVVCGRDGAVHVLVWHGGPVVAAALVGLVAGGRLLRRRPRA